MNNCPMCTYENKKCVGGAHVNALYEMGVRTVEDYKIKILQLCAECGLEGGKHKASCSFYKSFKPRTWGDGDLDTV